MKEWWNDLSYNARDMITFFSIMIIILSILFTGWFTSALYQKNLFNRFSERKVTYWEAFWTSPKVVAYSGEEPK